MVVVCCIRKCCDCKFHKEKNKLPISQDDKNPKQLLSQEKKSGKKSQGQESVKSPREGDLV